MQYNIRCPEQVKSIGIAVVVVVVVVLFVCFSSNVILVLVPSILLSDTFVV